MKRQLLALLRCPGDGGTLSPTVRANEGEDIQEGHLTCVTCERQYAVRRGVPRFVDSDKYTGNFGFEWNVHRRTQLDTETRQNSRDQFFRSTGFLPGELQGKLILDAGCGAGRYADVASRCDGTVVAVDLSLAVDAVHRNLGERENVHVVQADICALPFAKQSFDYVFTIGVLHHTPDPKVAFKSLLPHLKAGGKAAVCVYGPIDPIVARMTDLYRKVTTKLPNRLLYGLCLTSVPLHYLYRFPLFKPFLYRLLPISPWPDWRWRVLDTFDWYSPKYQSKHTYYEVFQWFEEAGLTKIRVLEEPVSLTGEKV